MVSKEWSHSVVDSEKSHTARWQHRGDTLNYWLWLAVMWLTTLRGLGELRELFKFSFKTTLSPTKSQQPKCLWHLLHLCEKSGAVKRVCTVTPQGRVWCWVRRIRESNGQCLTLMKSPDEEADWSPSTDQPLPFSFSWVPRCITGGISRLIADLCGLNVPLHIQYMYVCVCIQCCPKVSDPYGDSQYFCTILIDLYGFCLLRLKWSGLISVSISAA